MEKILKECVLNYYISVVSLRLSVKFSWADSLMQLLAQENSIEYCQCESFKTYIFEIYFKAIAFLFHKLDINNVVV